MWKVLLWRAAMALCNWVLWLLLWPALAGGALVRCLRRWADAAEVEWLLALAWRRYRAGQASLTEDCGRTWRGLHPGCCHRPDCADLHCPGRGR